MFAEVLEEVSGKQRMPFCFVMNQRSKLWREIMWRKSGVQVFSNMITCQRVERHFFAKPVTLHFSFVTLQRMIVPFDVFRSKRPGYQEALIGDPVTKVTQKIDTRWVRPVQVLQQQANWYRRRKVA